MCDMCKYIFVKSEMHGVHVDLLVLFGTCVW